MKYIFWIPVSAAALAGILLFSGAAHAQGIPPLQQFTSTSSPVVGITQTVYGKSLVISGLTPGLCLALDANNKVITTACGSGSGTVSTSTALVSGQVDFSTGVNTIGNDSTFLFDTVAKLLTATNASTTALSVAGNGLVGTPSIRIGSTGNAGIYLANTATLGLTNGTAGLSWNGSGFYPNTDNVRTLGLSANRWLDYWGSGTATTSVQYISSLATAAGAFLAVDPLGRVIATTTPSGGSGTWPFTPSTNYAVAVQATTTPPWFQGGAFASSSSAYSTLAVEQDSTGPAATFLGGNVGVATTSPSQNLSIGGNLIIGASTAGGTNGALTYGGVTLTNTVTGTGSMVLSASPSFAGTVTAANIRGTTNGTSGIVWSGSSIAQTTGTLTIQDSSLAASAPLSRLTFTTGGIAVNGTTTPVTGSFDIATSSAPGYTPQFVLTDTNAGTNLKHWYFGSLGGQLSIGTTSDAFATSSVPALSIDTSGRVKANCFTNDGVTCLTSAAGTNYFTNSGANTYLSTGTKLGVGSSTPYSQIGVGGSAVGTTLLALDAESGQTASILDVKLASTTVFLVASTGNVGVGTTSPYAKLSVKGAGSTTGVNFQTTNSSDAPLFTILDSGSVGVGTTTPTQLFSVGGTAFVGASTAGGTSGGLGVGTMETGAGKITASGNITSSGRFYSGVGTAAAPTYSFGNDTTTGLYRVTTNTLGFVTNGTEDARFTSTGAFGVGTTSPWGQLSATSTGANPALAIGQTGTGPAAIFTGGNVGIGTTSPNWVLSISTSTAPQLHFGDGAGMVAGMAMRQTPAGYFYLSTTSPTTYATSSVASLMIDPNGYLTNPILGTPAGTFLAADPNGKIIATTTPSGSGISAGFTQAVSWATSAVLAGTPTYSNGSSGVGATLTEVGSGALSVDGNAPAAGDRVLVKNQASGLQNGIYTVTATGSGIASYVLTRSTDYNSSTTIYPGINTYSVGGTANTDTTWAMTSAAPITVGTTALTYVESAAGVGFSIGPTGQLQTGPAVTIATSSTAFNGLTASTTVTATGNIITFANTLAGLLGVGGGGTGQSSYTIGDILYASATNVLSKLGIGSTGQVLTVAGGVPTWATPNAAATFELVQPAYLSTGAEVESAAIDSNTTAFIGGFVLPSPITVNTLYFDVTTKTTTGTVQIGIYDAQGVRKIDVTSPSISATGMVTVTLGAGVTLTPGTYYFSITPISTTVIKTANWARMTTYDDLFNGAGSAAAWYGTISTSAGTSPTSITPSALNTSANGGMPILRLQN